MKNAMNRMNRQRGFTLIELLIVLAVIGTAIGVAVPMTGRIYHWGQNKILSWQMAQVLRGAQNYVTVNEATVEANAMAGTYVLPVSTLQTGSPAYLWPSLVNSAANGGQFVILVRRIAPGELETIVEDFGGVALNDQDCGDVSANLGGDGGCVYTYSPTTISGTDGGWSTAIANFPGTAFTPTVGTPVAATYFEGTQIVSPYLHRYPIGGQSEPQRMHAPIDMFNNGVSNAMSLGAHATAMATVAAGAACPTAGVLAQNASLGLMVCDTTLVWVSAPAGIVAGDTLLPAALQTVGTACLISGQLGQSATGATLYCNGTSKTWQAPSATANFVIWY